MKWLLIFSLIFALLGCTGGPKNQAKLEVSAAFLNANLNAGLMLYIINKDKNTQRSIKLTGNTITVQLEDGNWDFAVLAWSGSSPMSGNLECAKASRSFKNSNEEIRLTLGVSDCDSDFFAPAVYRSSTIKKLDLVNCTSISDITSDSSPCSKGPALSYKVRLLGHRERAVSDLPSLSIPIVPKPVHELVSECFDLNTSNSITNTNLTIPFGSQAFHPPTIIETYTDPDCFSGKQTLFFPDGLAQTEASEHSAKSFAGTNGVVFFDYGALHVADTNSFSPALVGGPAQTKLITLNNYSGSAIYHISWTLSQGEFSFAGGDCGTTLTATQSTCDLGVQLNPTTGGLKQSTLTISYSLSQNGPTKTIKSLLSGNGITLPVPNSVAPNAIDFNVVTQNVAPAKKYVTLTFNNWTGPAPDKIIFSIGGINPLKFTPDLESPCTSSGTTVNCTVSIAFNNDVSPVYGNFANHKLQLQYNIDGTLLPASPIIVLPISASEIATGDGSTTGVVSPFYTGATYLGSVASNYWNIYVNDSKPYQTNTASECDTVNNGICQHRGDKRVTVLPSDFTSCGNLVGIDILNVFKWECYLDVSTVKFRIKEFNPNKGLKDLIHFTTSKWRPIQFRAYDGNTVVYQTALTDPIVSPAGHWWGNFIQNIDGLDGINYNQTSSLPSVDNVTNLNPTGNIVTAGGSLHSFDLDTNGMIYVHSTDLDVPSIHIGGKNVSLVSLDSKKIKSNNSSHSTCSSSTGGVASADKNALICVGGTAGQKHAWIEVNAEGKSNLNDLTVFMKTPAFARIHNSKLTKGGTALTIDNALKPNLITRTETSDNKTHGVVIYQSSFVVLDSLWSFKNEGNGLTLEGSKDNRIFGSTLSFNQKRGAHFLNSMTFNNMLHDSVIADNCKNSGSSALGAIHFDESTTNNAYNLLITGNACYGLIIFNPITANSFSSYNNFLNLTLTNNDDGIFIDHSWNNTFVNVISSNTTLNNLGAGLFLNFSDANKFTNFVTTNNNKGVGFDNSSDNIFTNTLLTGTNYLGQDCKTEPNSTGNTLSNTPTMTDCFSSITRSGINLEGSFIGKVSSDEKNNDNLAYSGNSYLGESSIQDFINFSNPFRYWGNNNSASPYDSPLMPPNASLCDGGDCAIWDWRLIADSNNPIWKKTGNGQASNSTFSGSCINELKGHQKISDDRVPTNTFLFRAFEIAFDGIGDDDGLCESNDECIYSPHFGAYQGEGNPMTTSCTPSSGNPNDLTGYKIYAYPTNGGL
jgi:hypothetical protein